MYHLLQACHLPPSSCFRLCIGIDIVTDAVNTQVNIENTKKNVHIRCYISEWFFNSYILTFIKQNIIAQVTVIVMLLIIHVRTARVGGTVFSRERNTGITLLFKCNSIEYHIVYEDLMTGFLVNRFRSTLPQCMWSMIIVSSSVTTPIDHCSA